MAVNRQVNFLGQQRVDVPHIRSLESAVCYDFDAVGLMITGGVPCVIKGFDVVNYPTVINSLASNLVISTAGSRIIHPLASDSGSFFQVPLDRPSEIINSNNTRVKGSWTAGTVNYVGIDLLRKSDSNTATTVRFLTTNPDTEVSNYVPLARTMDYVITISTTPFSVTPSICPLLIVTTDSYQKITVIRDARNLLFSNGSGGDSPSYNNPFGWPGGRNTATTATYLTAGDKSIKSIKQWNNAVMTRLQEIAGGEYWFSLTADRNVRMTQEGVFDSNGESFEWTGTNLHWKGIRFVFDNSTTYINELQDQLTNSTGLTDLVDGECIYVDLDRSLAHTVGGSNPLFAQKAVLATLSGSSTPGQRWTIAQRIGSKIFIRDQSYPVGSAFKVATIAAAGMIRTTINANGTISDPIAVGLADSGAGFYTATCGGISHNTDRGTTLIPAGNIIIGRGAASGDGSVFIQSDTEDKPVILYGKTNYAASQSPAVKIVQGDNSVDGIIASFGLGFNSLPSTADNSTSFTTINNDGSIAMSTASQTFKPVGVSGTDNITYQKFFFRTSKTYKGTVDAIYDPGNNVHQDGTGDAIFSGWTEGPIGTWTAPSNGSMTSGILQGVTPVQGLLVLVTEIGATQSDRVYGIYTITSIGSPSTKVVLTRNSNIPLFNGVTIYNRAAVGAFAQSFMVCDTPDFIIIDTTPVHFSPTGSDYKTEYCIMWQDGTVTPIAQSPTSFILIPS
jgi:hypothetical protein